MIVDGHAALARLLADRPKLHLGATEDWSLDPRALELLAATVVPGWRVLETGCGYSTVVLAGAGASLTTVAPVAAERDAIARWCREHGVPFDHVRFEVGLSQDVLPSLTYGERLDLVLVDGSHALPMPFLDWFYAASHLRDGGLVVVDDVQLRGPRLLRDFLTADAPRWRHVRDVGRSAVFARVGTSYLVPLDDWVGQPWSQHRSAAQRLEEVGRRVRASVRLRSRVRRALGR